MLYPCAGCIYFVLHVENSVIVSIIVYRIEKQMRGSKVESPFIYNVLFMSIYIFASTVHTKLIIQINLLE